MRVLGTAVCVVVIVSGCSPDEPRHDAGELARIDGPGGYVRWLAPAVDGDEPAVEIVATFPERPLLAPKFVAEHGAVAAYVALAAGEPLPAALQAYAPNDMKSIDGAAINRAMLDRAFADTPPEDIAYDASACDNAFKDWVRSSYGEGYGDTTNCTTNGGFTPGSSYTYYCQSPLDNDCTYPIGHLDDCSPGASETYSAFEGQLQFRRARHHLYSDGYYTYNEYGHRYRFAAANCDGTGNMVMWHRRGGVAWSTVLVTPRSMAIRVAGREHLPSAAAVIDDVRNANWVEHVPLGGPSYQLNQLIIDPLPGSPGGYACADVQREFETADITWSGANGGRDFCADATCNNCWND